MAANYKASRQYAVDYDLLFLRCQEALDLCNFTIQDVNPSFGRLKAKAEGGWKSWGENIDVQVSQAGAVLIHSECSVSLTLFDYGKNKDNVEKFFKTLNTILKRNGSHSERKRPYHPGDAEEQIAVMGKARQNTLLAPIIISVAIVWMLVLIVVVLGMYFSKQSVTQQDRNFQDDFAPLADVCRGKWYNVPSIYSSTPGKHPAVAARNSADGWQLDEALIPGEALAQSPAETQVVLCLRSVQEIFIERCPYTLQDGSGAIKVIDRYYLKQEARLVEAQTGRVITKQTFTGKSPRYCDSMERFAENENTVKLVGSEISDEEVQSWVSSHLLIQ